MSRTISPSDTDQQVSERLERLKKGYEALTNTESFKQWLRILGTQYQYSVNNLILIWLAMPNASMTRGYGQWQQHERQVRKGEKAIQIYAPIIKEIVEEGVKSKRCVGFRTVNVFDISQTDGPDVSLPPITLEEDGEETPELTEIRLRLERNLHNMAVEVTVKELDPNIGGVCYPLKREIVLNGVHGPVRRFKTLMHETAHQLTFDTLQADELKGITKSDHEFLAESTSYVACAHCGLETEDFTATYLAHYTRTADQLQTLMPTIHALAKSMIGLLEHTA